MIKAKELFYDEIVIGTGPSAMGYLVGMKDELSDGKKTTLLITRDVLTDKVVRHHPKLSSNNQCLVDSNNTSGFRLPGSTSAHGGLSNAWGGVLVELSEDVIKKSYKCDYKDAKKIRTYYSKILSEIKKDREVDEFSTGMGGEKVHVIKGSEDYGWETQGLSITPTIERLANELGVGIQRGLNINSVTKTNKKFKWKLEGIINDEVVICYCNELVLAAGLVSNISLYHASKSIPDILDHLPYQIACFSFSKSITKSIQTPVVKISNDNQHIAVEYRINKLSRTFLVSLYGTMMGALFHHMSQIFPISMWQIWTESTNIEVSNKNKKVEASGAGWLNLFKILFRVLKLKGIPFGVIKTQEGEGFHYISPNFLSGEIRSIVDSHELLLILGGAAMRDLPVHHPSLTFMAHAAWVGAKNDKN